MNTERDRTREAGGDSRPAVGAFVVNYDGGERIVRTVDAILAQTIPPREVLVVDNGSRDDSVRTIRERFPSVRILELGENLGLSKARNEALRRMTTDLVLGLDADVYLASDALAHLVDTYLVSRPVVVTARIVLHEDPSTVQCDGAAIHFVGTLTLRHGFRSADSVPMEVAEIGAVSGACLLFDREATLAAGGFDESFFFYFEDLEFSYRMRALGHAFVCDERVIARHDRGAGTTGLSFRGTGSYPARRARLTMRHRLRTIFVHYEVRTILVLAPVLLLYELASFVVALGRGWIGEWFRSWGWIAGNAREIAQARRAIQRVRTRRDREILTGGPLPIAPGFARSGAARAALSILSAALNGYWKIARTLLR